MAGTLHPYPLGARRSPPVPELPYQRRSGIEYSDLPWDTIAGILRAAERGETERWADLTRRMLTDGHLCAVYETRKTVLAQAKLQVEPESDDPIDVRGAEVAQRMLDALPVQRIKRDMADAVGVGWACLQKRWKARADGWLWPVAVEWNHPRRFRFSWKFQPYIYDDGTAAQYQSQLSAEERQRCRDEGINGMPLDRHRWIVHLPRNFPDYPNMGGILRAAVSPWWFKAYAIRYNLSGAEMAGNGRVIGVVDPNADADTKTALRENLENWAADGVIVVSPGTDIRLEAPLAQGSSSVWQSLVDLADRQMSKAILGSTLAADTGSYGSRSLGESQKDATIDPRAESDEEEIRHTLKRDLVDNFLELNAWAFGGRMPQVRLVSTWVEEDTPTVDELLVKVGGATINELRGARGLAPWPAEQGGDEIAKLPEAAPAFGAGFGDALPPGAIPAADPMQAIDAGSEWRDTVDGHAIRVTSVADGFVYFVDPEYVDPKYGPQPERQWRWRAATFLERCTPIAAGVPSDVSPPAPGGAPAASPLSEGDGGGGPGTDGSGIPAEAHGDLWALADAPTRAEALSGLGHPGILTAQAMLDGAPLWAEMREALLAAARRSTDAAELRKALAAWSRRPEAELVEQLRQVLLQGNMAGQLFVRLYEVPELLPRMIANAADGGGPARPPAFFSMPFDEAVAAFEARRIVTPDEFDAMDEDARSRAFIARRLAHETLVARARDLLARTLRDGGTFADFRRALEEDEAALGVTPSSPWYLETVYRSNVQAAYGAGRYQQITNPDVVAARPYVERRTARDNRVRETHAALDGAVFAQDDPGLSSFAPPYYAGEFAFNCRCVLVARRAEDVDMSKLVSTSSIE